MAGCQALLYVQQVLHHQLGKAEHLDEVELAEVAGVLCFDVPIRHHPHHFLQGVKVHVPYLQSVARSRDCLRGGLFLLARDAKPHGV